MRLAFFFLFPILVSCTQLEPVSPEQLAEQGREFLDQYSADESAAQTDVLTLESALAIALERNLDFRIQMLQKAVASGDARLASMDMLPRLAATAGYSSRNNVNGSVSKSIATGQVSLIPSTSQDQSIRNAGMEASWNILDVALAWSRARSAGEQYLLAEEQRRRATHMIARDVIYAWYLAAGYEALAPALAEIDGLIREALEKSEEIQRRGLRDPVEVLEYRKALLLVLKRVNTVSRDMQTAKSELSSLLAMSPSAEFSLGLTGASLSALDAVSASGDAWQAAALLNRPEVRSAWYEVRDAKRQGWNQFLRTMPQLVFSYGRNYSSNSFLVNDTWREEGVDISWDLLQLARMPTVLRQGRLRKELAEARRDLQIRAVLSQVQISARMLDSAVQRGCISAELEDAEATRLALLSARQSQASLDRLSVIRAKADHLLLRVEKVLDNAERVRSVVMMLSSAGVGILPPETTAETADELTAELADWLVNGLPAYLAQMLEASQRALPELDAGEGIIALGADVCFE